MSIHGDVHAALITRLLTWTAVPSVARENRGFTKVTDEPYLRERLAPQDSALGTLGPHGRIRHSGMWFVDVFTAPGLGITQADDLADAIIALFQPTLVLTYTGRVVCIERTYRSAGQSNADWYMVPVAIAWYTDTVNTI